MEPSSGELSLSLRGNVIVADQDVNILFLAVRVASNGATTVESWKTILTTTSEDSLNEPAPREIFSALGRSLCRRLR
jgi:hypothetical protein